MSVIEVNYTITDNSFIEMQPITSQIALLDTNGGIMF